MTIGAALVLLAVIWFMVLFVALPLGIKSQDEDGEVVPGTPPSAPTDPKLRKKILWVSITSLVIWAICAYVISNRLITLEMLGF